MNPRQRFLAVAALFAATIAGHGHALAGRSASPGVPAPRWGLSSTTLTLGDVPATSSRIDAR